MRVIIAGSRNMLDTAKRKNLKIYEYIIKTFRRFKMQIDCTDGETKRIIANSEVPVLVYFWGSACSACKAFAPTLSEIAKDRSTEVRVVKVNVDTEVDLAHRYHVRSLPTILIFKKGTLLDTKLTVSSRNDLEQFINRNLK